MSCWDEASLPLTDPLVPALGRERGDPLQPLGPLGLAVSSRELQNQRLRHLLLCVETSGAHQGENEGENEDRDEEMVVDRVIAREEYK